MRLPALILALAAGPLLAFSGCEPPSVLLLGYPERVGTWERFESLGIVWHGAENAFDPAAVDLRGEFVAPDGSVFEMPGFATREFRRELVAGAERLSSRTPLHFRVRFTPTRPGVWRWRWRLTTPAGSDASPWRTFTAAPPGPDRHGVLRVSPRDARYLRFEDGTPYFAIGENLAWYDRRGSFAYDAWFDRLAAQGVNYVRLWMPSWAFGIEWLRREDGEIASLSLGDYEERLDRAWQLDRVLEAAEAHGIYVMLCIQNHGPFSLTANSEWLDNPYNASNGGPLAQPEDFFDDAEARRLFKRRLRYLVARWGYSTHLLAWELWNEVNLVASPALPAVQAWHAEMARELRALDPYDHLITTSVSLGDEQNPLWTIPEIAFTQTHIYNWPFLQDTGFLLGSFSARARVPGKPTLIGETGADFRGPAETRRTDPAHIGFHDALWVGVLAETFGTGMSWWWDNLVDPEDLYPHFGAVARFVEGVAFDEEAFVAQRPAASASDRSLTAWALVGRGTVLVWLKNLEHQFGATGSSGDPRPVEGAILELADLAEGAWRARWIDTTDGREIRADAAEAVGGRVTLTAPAFVGDVALRMERP